MTTIAYSHKDKEIAVDSRMTECDMIITDNDEKFTKIGNEIFISCGGVSAGNDLINEYLGEPQGKENLDANIIIIRSDGLFCASYLDGKLNIWKINHDTAWGNGEKFALGAMDHGKSAKEAVEYAMTRDIYTGGKVHVFTVPQEA